MTLAPPRSTLLFQQQLNNRTSSSKKNFSDTWRLMGKSAMAKK
jgi:hypothetical protein